MKIEFRPQIGFQERYLSSTADIVVGGGAAGAGKTFALIYEGTRYREVQGFGGVIFRRTYPEIMNEGGLWDEAKAVYPYFGAKSNESNTTWTYANGNKISFRHLQYEKDLSKYQGSQMAFIGFDELTHFTKTMFLYLLTRNRSTSGVKPYIRATCNPDPDSWVADFLGWWIDQETGFPIKERAGVVRYFTVDQDNFIWGDSPQEVINQCPHIFSDSAFEGIHKEDLIKSATFVPGSITDNKKLLAVDPGYLANLSAQEESVRLRLKDGNWKVRTDNLNLFHHDSLKNMFTNILNQRPPIKRYITVDHARFGQDLCVIGTWEGWKLVCIDVLTVSDSNQIVKLINQRRAQYGPIPVSQVMVDQDAIGVQDIMSCKIYQGNRVPYKVKQGREKPVGKRIVPNFENRRAQCYFKVSDYVNDNQVLINIDNCYVDGLKTNKVVIRGVTKYIKDMIVDDLRTLKRENPDEIDKAKITKKEEQKNAIGRSPDFGDMMQIRGAFEFEKQPMRVTG